MKVACLFLLLVTLTSSTANVITFSKALFIPGEYFSLMNFTYNIAKLENYLDIDISYQLTQVPRHPQR